MANNILFDYAFNFTEGGESTGGADLTFLHKVYLPVLASIPKPDAPVFDQQPDPQTQSIDVGQSPIPSVQPITAHAHNSDGGVADDDGITYRWENTISPENPNSWNAFAVGDTITPEQPTTDGYVMYYRCIAKSAEDIETISDNAIVQGVDTTKPPVITKREQELKRSNFLGKMGVKSGLKAKVVTCYSMEDVARYTANTEAQALFDAGMGAVELVLFWDDAIAEINAALLSSNYAFTFLWTNDVMETEIDGLASLHPDGFNGVVGAVTTDRTKAEERAAQDLVCSFLDYGRLTYGMLYAFGKLLSGNKWSDQQYIKAPDGKVTAIETYGEADALFFKHVSFYLHDDTQGDRLGFFAAGGKAITLPYIENEIKLVLQAAGVSYLSGQQPRMTTGEIIRLENRLKDVIEQYEDDYGYLDPDADNTINLYVSANKQYCLDGDLYACVTDPIWRVFVVAHESCGL